MYKLISVEDTESRSFPCDLCGTLLRYVHRIHSDYTGDDKSIGCECFRLYFEEQLLKRHPADGDKKLRDRLSQEHIDLLHILDSLVVKGLQFTFKALAQ